jgi:hypothetical protein
MKRIFPFFACFLAIAITGTFLAVSAAASPAENIKVSLVRQDFSDCVNSDVTDDDGVGGFIIVHVKENRELLVNVHLATGTPDTRYNVHLKCIGYAGELFTNPNGVGNVTFTVSPNTVPAVFAFDMYPDGAPLGNKYQSVQVRLTE